MTSFEGDTPAGVSEARVASADPATYPAEVQQAMLDATLAAFGL